MPTDTFESLRCGQMFRFFPTGQVTYAVKGRLLNNEECALVLSPTKTGLRPGDLINAGEVGPLVPVEDVKLELSARPENISPGAGFAALPGEVELRGGGLVFVTQPQGGLYMRVDLRSGAIGYSSGERPVEIYSAWSLVRTGPDLYEVLYEHKPVAQNNAA